MSELLTEVVDQERIGTIVASVGRIIENSFLISVLQQDTQSASLGWGIIEYRAGEDILGATPSNVGQEPAEITYYAEIPAIDVKGAVFWHGPESLARKRGELFGIYLDPELVDNKYTHYHQIRESEGGQLAIGRLNDEGTDKLLPPEELKLRKLELKLSALVGYVEGVSRALR